MIDRLIDGAIVILAAALIVVIAEVVVPGQAAVAGHIIRFDLGFGA